MVCISLACHEFEMAIDKKEPLAMNNSRDTPHHDASEESDTASLAARPDIYNNKYT